MSEVITEYVNNTQNKIALRPKWWLEPNEEIYQHIWSIVNQVNNNQMFLQAAYARYAALYSSMEFLGLSSKIFSRTALNSFFNNRLSLNVIKSCTDTAASKIASKRPRPIFLTTDGDYSQQNRAKKLTKFMDGIFDEANVYEVGTRSFVDGCIFGTGVMKLYVCNGKIKAERIFPEELTVDEADGIYSEPTQIHQTKYYSRDTLVDMFPKYKEKISCSTAGIRNDLAYRTISDQVCVRESWHLPSAKDSKDGKHVICIDNCTLFSEQYNKDYFPFVFFRWNPRLYGFFGMGLAEELVGIQLEITKILISIQRSIHLIGVPSIWVENGSMINTQTVTNEVGSINKYTGQPPVFMTPSPISQEVVNHLENLYRKAYEITGISMLNATSQKPQGLNSGVAMREYQDIVSERFLVTGQRYEQFYMDAAKIIIDMAKDMHTKDNNLSVKVKDGKFMATINWKEVDMDADEYVMRVFPTSLLPTTPAGRLQTVQELIQAGFISKEDGTSLLDFPDIDSFLSLQNANRDNIMEMIEDMIEHGQYDSPEPFMNLITAKNMVQAAYLKARKNKVPEDRLELLRRFIEECTALGAIAQQQANPTPTAAPMRPERSDLIPNVPQGGVNGQ